MQTVFCKRIGFQVFLLILGLFLSVETYAQKEEITKIFLVRHAEKEKDGGKDPKLTYVGQQRAAALVDILQKVDIAAVYSTNYKRTRNTAKPLASAKKLKIQLYNPMDSRKFLDGVLEKHKGKTILVVGHSNTIPLLINSLLGEEKYESLDENEYSNLFMVSIVYGRDADVVQLTFNPK